MDRQPTTAKQPTPTGEHASRLPWAVACECGESFRSVAALHEHVTSAPEPVSPPAAGLRDELWVAHRLTSRRVCSGCGALERDTRPCSGENYRDAHAVGGAVPDYCGPFKPAFTPEALDALAALVERKTEEAVAAFREEQRVDWERRGLSLGPML